MADEERDREQRALLREISIGIRMLVVVLLLAAAVFLYWHYKQGQDRDASRYVDCIQVNDPADC